MCINIYVVGTYKGGFTMISDAGCSGALIDLAHGGLGHNSLISFIKYFLKYLVYQ